ncbi:MAG TPA: hypothetical protein VJN95_16530 [Gemmatimonadales bacterium]|nr:hypothetical protein [Gemmatimonadales bacterium]
MKTLLLILIIVAGAYYYLSQQKPGVGPKADAGFRVAAPIISAINQFRDAKSGPPGILMELVPEYLPSIPRQINGHPILYQIRPDGYELTFSYADPLPVHCTYMPKTKWKCGWLN